MAEYKNEKLETSFSISDKLTVRQQLAWRSRLTMEQASEPDYFIRFWLATRNLLDNWQSQHIEDPMTFDIDVSTDPKASNVIFWAVDKISDHLNSLESLEKKQ